MPSAAGRDPFRNRACTKPATPTAATTAKHTLNALPRNSDNTKASTTVPASPKTAKGTQTSVTVKSRLFTLLATISSGASTANV